MSDNVRYMLIVGTAAYMTTVIYVTLSWAAVSGQDLLLDVFVTTAIVSPILILPGSLIATLMFGPSGAIRETNPVLASVVTGIVGAIILSVFADFDTGALIAGFMIGGSSGWVGNRWRQSRWRHLAIAVSFGLATAAISIVLELHRLSKLAV